MNAHARLADQESARLNALATVAKLRVTARDEIERLLAFLDETDGYSTTELEMETEHDEPTNDDEPSIGSTSSIDQNQWSAGNKNDVDIEDEHDGAEPENEHGDGDPDNEPSLGWPENRAGQGPGSIGDAGDREICVPSDPSFRAAYKSGRRSKGVRLNDWPYFTSPISRLTGLSEQQSKALKTRLSATLV